MSNLPAMSSIADNRVTIAPWCDSSFDPNARVVVVTISIANGIDATTITTVNDSASTIDVMCTKCKYTTAHSVKETTTNTIIMSISMFCKLLGSLSPCRNILDKIRLLNLMKTK